MHSPSLLSCSIDDFGRLNFEAARLGDRRLCGRAQKIATAMALRPGASIPKCFDHRRDIKAAYEFFDHEDATPENILAGHFEAVRRSVAGKKGTWLLIEDTSEFDYSSREERIAGLGPTGPGSANRQGFFLHSVIAARVPGGSGGAQGEMARREPVEVAGLIHQEYYIRRPRPKNEPKSRSFRTRQRERESELFERSTESIGPAPKGTRYIRVADRGADIYTSLRMYEERGHGYVIRAARDRSLLGGEKHLFEEARAAAPFGQTVTIHLRARGSNPARDVRLQIAALPVSLRSPQLPGAAAGTLPAIECTCVRVFEEDAGENALEWILLTSEAADTAAKAREIACIYATRWLIEEFHKTLKSGLGAERLQLETKERLFAAVALMCPVALRLVDLRERLRLIPEAPATRAGLDDMQLKLLALRLGRNLKTVRDVALAIGRLGGHMNRKGDGMPGIKTLYLGLQELDTMVAGVKLFMHQES